MKKKLLCLILVVLFALSLVSCFRSDEKYDYDMSKYITLANYKGYEVVVNLDDISRSIDSALLEKATQYKVKAGDTIYVEILNPCYVEYLKDDDGNLVKDSGGNFIDMKGEEIPALANDNLKIENVCSGSYAPDLEIGIVGSKIGEIVSLKIKLPDDFANAEYAGKEVYMDVKIKDRACKSGDGVTVSYKGYYTVKNEDGGIVKKKDENGEYVTFDSSDSANFYLGSHLAIDDFEENIIGLRLTDDKSTEINENKKEFFATFPDDYGVDTLNGQTVIFEVTLTSILEVPVFNDEFVKTYYSSYSTTEELEQSLIDNYVKNTVYTHLTNDSTVIKYPKSEYKNAEESIKNNEEAFKSTYGIDFDTYLKNYYGMTRDEYIKSQLLTEMIYYSISKSENIVPSQEALDKAHEDAVEKYKQIYISEYSMGENEAFTSATKYVDEYLGSTYIYEETMYKMVDEFILSAAKVTKNDKTFTSVTEERAGK
ncbi:MAG: hypothetical protein ACI3XS_07190 [Eubacteriales bacterium]